MRYNSRCYVPKELETNLEKLNFDEKVVKNITRKLQTISVSGTVKIMKHFPGIQNLKSNLELFVLCSLTFYFVILKHLFALSLFYCLEPNYMYCTYYCLNGIF